MSYKIHLEKILEEERSCQEAVAVTEREK